jgi:hypothetical protein
MEMPVLPNFASVLADRFFLTFIGIRVFYISVNIPSGPAAEALPLFCF